MRSRWLGATPGPSSSTTISAPSSARSTRTQIRESPGCAWRRCPSRFSTIRSIMIASAAITKGAVSSCSRRPATTSALAASSRTNAPTSTGTKIGSTTPAARRSRSSRSATMRSEPPGVRRDPARQVPCLVRRQIQVIALQGPRQPQDRGERRSQIVRDGLQEGALHRVGFAELFAGEPLAREVALQALGRAAAG